MTNKSNEIEYTITDMSEFSSNVIIDGDKVIARCDCIIYINCIEVSLKAKQIINIREVLKNEI